MTVKQKLVISSQPQVLTKNDKYKNILTLRQVFSV